MTLSADTLCLAQLCLPQRQPNTNTDTWLNSINRHQSTKNPNLSSSFTCHKDVALYFDEMFEVRCDDSRWSSAEQHQLLSTAVLCCNADWALSHDDFYVEKTNRINDRRRRHRALPQFEPMDHVPSVVVCAQATIKSARGNECGCRAERKKVTRLVSLRLSHSHCSYREAAACNPQTLALSLTSPATPEVNTTV